ncbi:MAG: hypothetical protein WCS03_18960 [Bacteroidota bacterium]
MKALIFKIVIILLGILTMNISCEKGNQINTCTKGMYIGSYCDGLVIKILDSSSIGKSWKATYGPETYEKSVVASVDSVYIKLVDVNQYFIPGTVFYFNYVNGGYPRKTDNICVPEPFITITSLSTKPCQTNK